ncbi:MAG: hypothetical protein H0T73_18960 [Ardenticatenales bacterium]|nr:hypothetical protein [Ardenticatenales bacterium]
MSEEPQIIEAEGDGWSVTLDMTAAPEYVMLTQRGKATTERAQTRLQILRTHLPRYLLPDGHYCPLIADQLKQATPSMASLKSSRSFLETFSGRLGYIVFLVEPERITHHLMAMNIEMLDKLLPGRYAFVTSMEEAKERVRAFHERQEWNDSPNS